MDYCVELVAGLLYVDWWLDYFIPTDTCRLQMRKLHCMLEEATMASERKKPETAEEKDATTKEDSRC